MFGVSPVAGSPLAMVVSTWPVLLLTAALLLGLAAAYPHRVSERATQRRTRTSLNQVSIAKGKKKKEKKKSFSKAAAYSFCVSEGKKMCCNLNTCIQ